MDIGLAAFALVAVVVSLVGAYAARMREDPEHTYDERQQLVLLRGEAWAYRVAATGLVLGFLVYEFLPGNLRPPMPLFLFCLLVVTATIEQTHAIWNDAYFGLGPQKTSWAVAGIAIGTVLIMGAAINAVWRVPATLDGTDAFLSVSLGVYWLLLGGVALARQAKSLRDDLSEDVDDPHEGLR